MRKYHGLTPDGYLHWANHISPLSIPQVSEISPSVLYCFPVPWCTSSRLWNWVLMAVMTSQGCSLQMRKRTVCMGKKGEDWLWEDNCSNLVFSLKKTSTNNKTPQRTFGNLKEEKWRSIKFSVCRNTFILFMFVISALEFPSGWCCLAWSDFNPLQKAFLNFPELTSHFFFTSNESFLFRGKKKKIFLPLSCVLLQSSYHHLLCVLCCWSLHFLCHSQVNGRYLHMAAWHLLLGAKCYLWSKIPGQNKC